MSDEKAIVIAQPWGGLGDNLAFSTLPELYAQLGFDVYISSTNVYRNPEIYDLIWKHNPYVKGVSDLPVNAGACMFGGEAPTTDYMTNIELGHGLTHGYRKYPVVYYTPKLIAELADVLLYDTTSISQEPSEESVKASFESVFYKHPGVPIRRLEFTKISNRSVRGLEHEPYKITSIYDLCDAIYSSKIFLSLHTGSATLASALKEDRASPLIYTILPSTIKPPQYMFANAVYMPYVTGHAFPPFHQNDPLFNTINLTWDEQTYVRGKPIRYIMYTLELFHKYTAAKVIVEVGSARQKMEHSINEFNPICCNDGHSTYFWRHHTKAEVYSIDIDPKCRDIIQNDPRLAGVTSVLQDANTYLETFEKKIDLLFLDAWDVIEGTPYAEEHVRAYKICKPKLSDNCLILIDDTDVANRGKGALLIPVLLADGFTCLTEGRQTLFIRVVVN